MSPVFVDTSAIIAFLVKTDRGHADALACFERLRSREAPLVTTSYVLVESYALLARRCGLDAARRFRAGFAPLLDVVWIDADLHERGLDRWLEAGKRRLSFVDAVSFVVAESRMIEEVFAFDPDFEAAGFRLLS